MSALARGITVVGLGAGEAPLAEEARAVLSSRPVYLRTARHPALGGLPGLTNCPAFDDRLARIDNLKGTLEVFLSDLIDQASSGQVAYAVPGSPCTVDASVRVLEEMAAGAGVTISYLGAPSVVDRVCREVPPGWLGPGLQVVDMLDLALVGERSPFAGGWLPLSPLQPAIVVNPAPASVMVAVAKALATLYPSMCEVAIVDEHAFTWTTLDRLPPADGRDWMAALYLPATSYETGGRTSDALQRIVARLRAPGGCPWDREQTHASLLQSGLEEAYEAFDAVERGEPVDMAEELGDLLLQVFMHAQIAEEDGEFTLEDVFDAVTAKLVRRHPHVFGDAVAETAGQVLSTWDQIKRRERTERGEAAHEHPLGKIPAALPALMRAQTVLRRGRRAGLPRLDEVQTRDRASDAPALVDELIAIALAANQAGIDLETALRARTHELEDEARQVAALSTTTPPAATGTRAPDDGTPPEGETSA